MVTNDLSLIKLVDLGLCTPAFTKDQQQRKMSGKTGAAMYLTVWWRREGDWDAASMRAGGQEGRREQAEQGKGEHWCADVSRRTKGI